MGGSAALKYSNYWFELLLGILEGKYTLEMKFFDLLFKLINQNHRKSRVKYAIGIDQSKMSDDKIATNGEMPLTAKYPVPKYTLEHNNLSHFEVLLWQCCCS